MICINNNNILVNVQFGFRSKSSIEMSSYTLICETYKALNNTRLAGGIYFDLEKALDCVNCSILLPKSEVYGIMDKAYTLIKSYLEGREQRLICKDKFSNNNTCSIWAIVKHGVSQGSVMGAVAFFYLY